jgi:hypothetical protein
MVAVRAAGLLESAAMWRAAVEHTVERMVAMLRQEARLVAEARIRRAGLPSA